jgi:hypothetical protein
MNAGAATLTINSELGTLIQGAGNPEQRVEYVRDSLEANALYLDDGTTKLLFISCDLACLESARVANYCRTIAAHTGVPADAVLIGCSHTHSGPVVTCTDPRKPVDEDYAARLEERLPAAAAQAVANAAPAEIGCSFGNARLGYNRRVCYRDGSHHMYRRPGHDHEYTGLEGPDDTTTLAMGIFDKSGRPRAVLHHGTGHPDAFFGRNFLSADYPGAARRLLREAYGEIPVLFFNGALGDIAMSQQYHAQALANEAEQKVLRFGTALAAETMRLLHETAPMPDCRIVHQRGELELPVHLPSQDCVAAGRKVLRRIEEGEDIRGMDAIFAWGPVSLMDRFGANPIDRIAVHVIRIGDLYIAAHPFELFCQYQLDIRRRSPSRNTAVFGLTDGYGGYLPTQAGARGGGYSGTPFEWARFAPEQGCRLVDELAGMLYAL